MKSVPKFIYFDLDDTLLDHKRAERKALGDIYEQFACFADTDLQMLIDAYHKINSRQWKLYSEGKIDREKLQKNRFSQTLEALDIDPSLHKEIGISYMKCYRNHWIWVDGAETAFEKVRKRYNVGILTNGFSETQQAKFNRFDLYDRAQHLVISEDVGHLKPHPKIFEHATSLTGYQPDEILYVGDSYNSDVKGGTDFGWQVAWFTSNGKEDQHMEASFIFDDFQSLCDKLDV